MMRGRKTHNNALGKLPVTIELSNVDGLHIVQCVYPQCWQCSGLQQFMCFTEFIRKDAGAVCMEAAEATALREGQLAGSVDQV